MRFRGTLAALDLSKRLFEAITKQLCAQQVSVKRGTLVDATIIASASKDDDEVRWSKHRNRKAVLGYKAHVACDEDTALLEKVRVTLANVNDGKAGCVTIPDDPAMFTPTAPIAGRVFRALSKGVAVEPGWWRHTSGPAKRMAPQKN